MEEGKEGGRERGKEEEGNGEEKRKVGRPSKAESWSRDRSNSAPLLELFKRGEKRKGEQGEERGVEEEEQALKRGAMVKRAQEQQVEGGLREMLREVREGFKEMGSELRELREGREEMREWMEEMRKRVENSERRVDNLERRVEEIEKGRGGMEKGEGEKEKGEGRG